MSEQLEPGGDVGALSDTNRAPVVTAVRSLLRLLRAAVAPEVPWQPAIFVGDWLDAAAVIVPFPRSTPGPVWLGALDFPDDQRVPVHDPATYRRTDLYADGYLAWRRGTWQWESPHHAPAPEAIAAALAWSPESGLLGAGLTESVAPERRSAPAGWTPYLEPRTPHPVSSRDAAPHSDDQAVYPHAAPTGSSSHPDPTAAADTPLWSVAWSAPERAPHLTAIARALEAIRAGEIYQACICTAFTGTFGGDVLEYFLAGVETLKPTKAALLQGNWGSYVSFSPELYLRRRGTTVTSAPIKGTLPLTADPADLRASVKDVAENLMIVDLVRNDLGRVAEIGSVTVPRLLDVVAAPGVWHLVSTVNATVTGSTAALLAATFPPGSVTGTPKTRARELIAHWESRSRGIYCGALGIGTGDTSLDLSVAIRTVSLSAPDSADQRAATLGVGGGITIDSDPENEWQECLHKAAPIITLTPPS